MLSHSPRRGVGASIWMPLKAPQRPHPALVIAALGVLFLAVTLPYVNKNTIEINI